MTPTIFALVLAFLAFAVVAIKYFVRSGDVLHGGYIEDSDHDRDGDKNETVVPHNADPQRSRLTQ